MDQQLNPDCVLIDGKSRDTFEIGFNAYVFVFAFAFATDVQDGSPSIHTRLVTSPVTAGHLCDVLSVSLQNYAQTFGPLAKDDYE